MLRLDENYINIATINGAIDSAVNDEATNLNKEELVTKAIDNIEKITPLHHYLETDSDHLSDFILCEKAMKYYDGLDIRTPESRNSCCFTKRYKQM